MTLLRTLVESRAAPKVVLSSVPGDWRDRVAGMLGFGTWAGKRISQDSALNVSPFYRGIMIRAKLPGTLPLHVYQKDDEGNRQQVELESDYYLWGRPNREVPRAVFWTTVFAQFALYENAYLYVVVDERRAPVELYPVEPHRVEIRRDDGGRKLYLVDGQTPVRDYVAGGEFVHLQGFGVDGMRGRGPLVTGRNALGLALAAEEYAGRWFGDGSDVGSYLSTDQEVNATQAKQISEMWEEAHSGGENRHRKAVLGKGTRYLTTDLDPEKAQLLPTRSYQVAEASRLTGVPEHLLGSHDKQSSWGQGIAEQNRGLLTYTVDPDLVIVEQTISDELLRPAKRYMKFNRGGLLRGSNLERARYLEILRRNEIINADEWRAEEDMAPRPDGGGQEYKNPNTSPTGEAASVSADATSEGA